MKKNSLAKLRCIIAGLGVALLSCGPAVADVAVHYRYALANFSGPIKTFQARLAVSRKTNEVFVFDYADKNIRIFNEHGMEIFRLGEEEEFARARDIAVSDEGDVFILFDLNGTGIVKYNFRGDILSTIKVQDLPPEFVDLRPSVIIFRDNRLYLVDPDALTILVLAQDGRYQTAFSVLEQVRDAAAMSKKMDKRQNTLFDISGFNVDSQGNMFFTVASIAMAFRLSPDGEITAFGKSGSSPGQFGVIAGIAIDDQGYIYLTDKLRCVVMLYDKDLNFIDEFGYRGYGPSNLIVPSDVAVSNGNIFVSQAASRGVSVYQIRAANDDMAPANE
jgi:hypothetical protein